MEVINSAGGSGASVTKCTGETRAVDLSFTTAEPQPLKAAEILQVFGELQQKQDKAALYGNTAVPAPVEAVYDLLKAAAERLKAELALIKQELRAARDDDRKELNRLLDLHAAQERLTEGRAKNSTLLLAQGEMAEAQAVLGAQRRVERNVGKLAPLERL